MNPRTFHEKDDTDLIRGWDLHFPIHGYNHSGIGTKRKSREEFKDSKPKERIMPKRSEQADELLLDNLLQFVAGPGHPILNHPITVDLRNSVLERMSSGNQSPTKMENAILRDVAPRFVALH